MKSYTLTELFVVISLIVIFLTIGIYFTQKVRHIYTLEKSKIFLVSKIHKARSLSLSPKKNGSSLPGGYGIYFPSFPTTKFYLFADLDNNYIWTGPSETIEECSLKKLTEISSATLSYGGVSRLDLLFITSKAEVYFNGSDSVSFAKITLKEKIGNSTSTIFINKLGQISF